MQHRICAGLLGLFVAVSSQAAVVITIETRDLTRKEPVAQAGRIAIDGNKMAMSGEGVDEVPEMIFRGDRELLWAIDPKRKEYVEIEKETIDAMSAQMDEAMKQMEQRLAEMPQQQRAMVERMMRERMPDPQRTASPLAEAVVKRTEERKEIAGYPCRKYEIYRDDDKMREIWVTPWSNVDQGREAFGIFSEMEAFFEGLLEGMKDSPFAGSLQNPFDQASKIDGFPVMTREFEDGEATREALFKSVQVQDLPATAFEPPKGYAKTDPAERVRNRQR